MIQVTNIRNVKHEDFDEVWAITQSSKPIPGWMRQVRELSPSEDLFGWYCEHSRIGTWNKSLFDTMFAPRFIREFTKSGVDRLNELAELDKAGKNIALVCYCPVETMCHRSIIAGFLQYMGCRVVTDRISGYYVDYAKQCPLVINYAHINKGED